QEDAGRLRSRRRAKGPCPGGLRSADQLSHRGADFLVSAPQFGDPLLGRLERCGQGARQVIDRLAPRGEGMNIFATSPDPIRSAQALDDFRLNKMIVESCQILSAALHITGRGTPDLYQL